MIFRLTAFVALAVVSALPAQVPDFYEMGTVRDVYLQFGQPNWWSQLEANYQPETNIAATMTVDGVTYPNVGVRFRGNTSYRNLPSAPNQGWEKKSFNIEMDWMVQGQDIYGYDSLNFNNGFHDPLFLREPLTYYVMRQHGVAPKANWIRLHLNGTYWGVYINVQQPNKDMFKEWFRSNDGNRYRCFPTSGNFRNGRCCYTWLGSNVSAYFSAYRVKQGDGLDLMNMCDVLDNTPSGTLQSVLTDVFNLDSFYRYAAVMNVCTQTDSYIGNSGKDHFLYIDEVHGDGTTLPFDLNEAMAESTSLSPTYNTTNPDRPAHARTLVFADWRERYKAHLNAIITHTFNPSHLTPLAQQYHAMIYNDVVSDPKKIYTTAAFQQNLNSSVTIPSTGQGQGNQTVPGLVPWIQARHTYLAGNSYVNAPRAALSNLSHSPQNPIPTQAITVTVDATPLATSVDLWSRALGKFTSQPMFDDGQHGDGAANDGTWGVILPAQMPGTLLDYYVEAATAIGAVSYEPHTAELERECGHVQIGWPTVSSPIAINEFVAQNVTGPVDENSQHEDWLELYNTSNQTVTVGGMWVSDTLERPKWEIPTGTQIAPNGVLRIWCDEDGTQGPMHANFKLSAGGEEVVLYAASGQAIADYYEFGQQYADISTGRMFDGQLPWVTFPQPTHLTTNLPSTCGQRTYGALDHDSQGVTLSLSGTLQIGTSAVFDIADGPAGGTALGALSTAPDYVDLGQFGLGGVTYLLPLTNTVVAGVLPLSGSGTASWTTALPNDPGFVGVRVYAQSLTVDGSTFDSSPAVELRICP
ncbi:MAG: CotH kinase family protein [bacterium]|nr:CotH kinase family protein [bacterium]